MDISFENPDLLHLLWVLALQALMLLWYWFWRRNTLSHLGSSELERRLLMGFSSSRFWIKNLLFALVVALIAVAIANPRQKKKQASTAQESADIIIALDVSRSMMATDVQPNRLSKAKQFIGSLLREVSNDRVGLLVFAGDAFVQAPLTQDPEVLLMFVRNAAPDAVNDQGTDFESAIQTALLMIPSDAEAGRALVVISDGENHTTGALEAATKAKNDEGLTIHTVAVGTSAGATVPTSTGLLKDYTGQTVRSAVNKLALQELARAGGGQAFDAADANCLPSLVSEIGKLEKASVESKAVMAYTSYYQWLVLAALLILMGEQLLWWRKSVKK